MTTKITSNNIETASVALLAGPKITTIAVTTSSYTVLDDTAVDTAGGYVKITGTGFESSCQVVVNNIAATSITFISSTEVRAQLPATAAGTYIVYLINPTGGVAIRVNGVTFSAVPAWSTNSTLPDGVTGNAVSIQLGATSNSSITYALAAGSTLPTGLSLTTSGLLSGTVTVANATTYNFTLVATDAELQDTSRAFSITISLGDPYFKNTTLLLSGNANNNATNNTFVDSSTNDFVITRTGNPTQGTFSPYGANWSLYTNGSSSYAYLPYSATRAIGTGDFSIECWVYIARQPANYTRVWSHQSNWGLAGSIGVELAFGTVDTLIQTLVDGNSTTYTSATYDTTGTGGTGHVRQWIHVVSSRQNGYLRLFVNGVLREANANSTNINGTSNTSFGTNSQLGGDLTELYISNFRICIGSVPTAYSTTSTTSGTSIFTPPTAPVTTTSQGASGVQLLLFQDNRIIDRSSNAFAVTTVGNPSIQHFSPFSLGAAYSAAVYGGSAYFDGNDYLTVAANAQFDFGTGDFTVEAWVYPVANGLNYPTFLASITGWSAGASGHRFNNTGYANKFWFGLNGSGGVASGDPFMASANTFSFNTWHHYSITRSGNTFKMFVNGALENTQTYSGSYNAGLGGLRSGWSTWDGAQGYFTGYVSNLRMVKGTAVYTSAFTPPTAPVTAITNTSLLLNYTFGGIIDGTMQNNLETVGDAKISTAQSKFGGSSVAFDGTGDYLISSPNAAVLNAFGTGDFTVEFWMNSISFANADNIKIVFDCRPLSTDGLYPCIYFFSGQIRYFVSSADRITGSTLNTGQWYHVALSRSGSSTKLFVDGTQVGSTYTDTNNYLCGANRPIIASRGHTLGDNNYNGYVDDLRITRGYARYTANFTPPTTAFLTQ